MAHAGGPLLYSDWAVSQGKDGTHEVTFSYTWRTSGFEILKETLTWTVVEDTRVVTGPLEVALNDGHSHADPRVVKPPPSNAVEDATEPSP